MFCVCPWVPSQWASPQTPDLKAPRRHAVTYPNHLNWLLLMFRKSNSVTLLNTELILFLKLTPKLQELNSTAYIHDLILLVTSHSLWPQVTLDWQHQNAKWSLKSWLCLCTPSALSQKLCSLKFRLCVVFRKAYISQFRLLGCDTMAKCGPRDT